ncbi:hypothetical protein DZG00_01900 [Clavibacter lycopersici]|uniref:Uncharacterized protein n=2 Tax=Clavibacter lycopersici TaxID=2301718 RepID=A0A399TAH3_9MICO|nr:hypothetical protein DZG00_01900 [Clavibacter lycopersici]RIJ62540.1 hypothetical protein DZG02_01255 [Clavibacter lycopersici]
MLRDHGRGLAADAPRTTLRWTGSMPRPRSVRAIAAAPLAVLLVLALGGCGAASTVGGMTTPADARIYATAADADGRIPTWIPADATDVRIKTSLRGEGAILEFRSATPADRMGCEAAPADAPAPSVQDTWWPDPSPAAAMTCGDGWLAAADGDAVHAWLPKGSRALDL